MGAIVLLAILFVLFIIVGAALGFVTNAKVSRIEDTVHRLEHRLRGLEKRLSERDEPTRDSRPAAAADTPRRPSVTASPPEPREPEPEPRRAAPTRPELPRAETKAAHPATPKPTFTAALVENMRENWMAWLGGISVSLAGVFLVGYGIEMGYLGPRARIVAAVIAGLMLHAAAEYFRRKTQVSHPAFAAMAGGGSITLYAAFYTALALYDLLSPGTTFTFLAIVSLLTMALATVHGPLLASIGILGAYIVPLLVSDVDPGTPFELGYSLIVTAAALFLIRFVYRPWLWYGTLAGALAWWLISIGNVSADGIRGYYLAAFAYLCLAIPSLNWTLTRTPRRSDAAMDRIPVGGERSLPAVVLAISLIALAQAASIVHLEFIGLGRSLLLWSPLIVVVLWASRTRESLRLVPWLLLITQLAAWLITALDDSRTGVVLTGLPPDVQGEFLAFALLMAVLFSAGLAISRIGRSLDHVQASLICLAPVLWLALSYLLVTDLSIDWRWSVATLGLGIAYIAASDYRLHDRPSDDTAVWLILGGHLAYSLAAAMLFREATLTLALAAQVISLSWLGRRFALPAIGWIVKGVLALVVVRLTLNPWLLTYPVDVHWSLWTYGGSVLCCWLGAVMTRADSPTKKWLEAATLHLLVLFLGAELRYWLYDGNIFVRDFTLREAAINTVIWGGLSLSYYNRARLSEHLARFYTICSRVLLVLALASYALTLTTLNPLWSGEPVGTTKIWNILLIAYGAPVIVAAIARFGYEDRFKRLSEAIAGAGLFVFVSLEVRHLWRGGLDTALGTSNGEIYTYSAVWLVMAVATMLAATRLGSKEGHRAGIAFLLVVIAKIFLYDMAGLEGLLRVASFMGLGLALLGLAWLYQRTTKQTA